MSDIVVDPKLLELGNSFAEYPKPDKHKFVIALANKYGLEAERLAPAGVGDVLKNLPFGGADGPRIGRAQTNSTYNLFAKIYDLLPDELRHVPENDGVVDFTTPIIASLDIKPFLTKLQNDGDLSDKELEIAKEARTNQDGINENIIKEFFLSQGIPENDERVLQAINDRRSDSTSTAQFGAFDFTARPATAGPAAPIDGTSVDSAPVAQDPEEIFNTQTGEVNYVGTVGQIPYGAETVQELLQADPSLGMADIAAYFGDYRFDLTGLALTGGLYSADTGDELTAAQALAYPYSLKTRDQRERLQDTLRRAGYFDPGKAGAQPTAGMIDGATATAWGLAIVDATRLGITVDKHLKERVRNFPRERVASQGVVFADPDALALSARNFGMELMGRGLTETELSSFISYIRKWENEAAMDASFTRDNYEVEMSAKAQTYFENEFATEVFKESLRDWLKLDPNNRNVG